MKEIFKNQEIIVLSNKDLAKIKRHIITFTDGSFVDINTRTITNKGSGEITIRDLPMWPPMVDIFKEQKTFKTIKRLSVSGDMNNIIILPNDGCECVVSIGGANYFVQNSSFYRRGEELHIETPQSKSNIHFSMGSIWLTAPHG